MLLSRGGQMSMDLTKNRPYVPSKRLMYNCILIDVEFIPITKISGSLLSMPTPLFAVSVYHRLFFKNIFLFKNILK